MAEDTALAAFAAQHGQSITAARALLAELRARAGADQFYIFWTSGGGAGGSAGARERTLLAFPTPDAALVFSQRNGLRRDGEQPRLRRFTLLQLIEALLRQPAIGALILVADDEPAPAGHLPRGERLERAELLRRLALEDNEAEDPL
jgi:hypothetical protein